MPRPLLVRRACSAAGGANPAECKPAWDLNNEVIYPSQLTDKERADADEKLGKMQLGNGTLRVLESRLGSPTADDEFGAIEWLKFEVDLHFPGAVKN